MNYSENQKIISFKTAQEAQDYAKKNIGVVITRASNSSGYIVKKRTPKKSSTFSNLSVNRKIQRRRPYSLPKILAENSDIAVPMASEVFSLSSKEKVLSSSKDEIIESEVSSVVGEELLVETLSPVSKTSIGLFGIGLLFGLPF